MHRRQVQSTCLRAVGYDSVGHVLEIEFTSGKVYDYTSVPVSVHRGLLRAESHGRYFNARIRGRYPFRLIAATEQVGRPATAS